MSKRHRWLPPEIEALRKLYPEHTAKFVPNVLERHAGSIYRKALALCLEKADGFWQRDASRRAQKGKQAPRMQPTQLKKGQTAWNKVSRAAQAYTPTAAPTISEQKGPHT